MIYDSAQLVELMTGVWQFNRNELCRQRVAETIDWMLRDMKLGDAFAAGLDADSESEEGKYYLWSEAEVDAALVGTFSARFKQVYGVTRDGSVMGKNILRRNTQIGGLSDADEALVAKQRACCWRRGTNGCAATRDIILTDWNGLAIRAVAQAGVVFERPDWLKAATAAYEYVKKVSGEGEKLYHSWRKASTAKRLFRRLCPDGARCLDAVGNHWRSGVPPGRQSLDQSPGRTVLG